MFRTDSDDLAALEWAAELDRRAWAATLPDHVRAALPWLEACQEMRANHHTNEVHGAAPGLVSVPTSGTPRCVPSPVPSRVSRLVETVRECIGAFAPDPVKSRLARMRRAVGFSARANCAEAGDVARCAMVTLTYEKADDWHPLDVSAYLKRVREWARRLGFRFRYVWVAEIQPERLRRTGDAVVHYHVAIWLPAGVQMPFADACGWWTKGATRTEWARAAVPYLLKYLSKGSDVAFPKGLRTFGAGGMSGEVKRARRWLGLPRFVQERSDIHDDWKRAEGGGWRDPWGIVWRSEFESVVIAGARHLRRVFSHGDGFKADGPFSWLKGEGFYRGIRDGGRVAPGLPGADGAGAVQRWRGGPGETVVQCAGRWVGLPACA